MVNREQVVALAHSHAKAYFKQMGEPTWTGKYQFEYPIFVENFIRTYMREVKRENKNKITDN